MNARKFFATYPLRPLRTLLYLAFWFGVLWLILGNFITFIPGAEQGWFTFTGVLLLAGLFLPRWPYRIAAIALVTVCVSAAIYGHRHGIEYRQYLQQHGLPTPRS